ncbi:MAG: NAD-dependent epimerase/dehydratase family protein [Halodesulfurarchaeum sp.]
MDVLITGAYGRVGTALIDHLGNRSEYDFTYLNRSDRPTDHPYGEYETVVADVSEFDAIRPAFDGQDAVVHLAADPQTDASWESVLENNVIGMYNVLEAAREAGVETFVFGSTHHVVGMYEVEHRPDIYEPEYGLVLDRNTPRRPDSYYGVSKSLGEDIGRYYVENHEFPKQFYSLRITTVRHDRYDHPYGDAERGVDRGEWDRGSPEYDEMVSRMKSTWLSRRDLAQIVDCCLTDTSVEYDVFYAVSDNDRRWYGLEHARSVIGYRPRDNAESWESPPSTT